MPTAGFPAFFEVAAETFGLTVASIVGSRYALLCLRESSSLNVSGLAACLLAAFCCLYGLTYWLNGIDGYDCAALAAATGTCLSLSNALTFLNLFILSNSLLKRSARWERYRWLGLVVTALNWATLVVHEVMETAEEDAAGIDGPRCVINSSVVAFRLKWVAQLLNQLFQAVAFLLPLNRQLTGAARVRFRSGDYKSRFAFGRTLRLPVWRSFIAEAISLLMTIVVAALAFAKADGHLATMPMFAVEVLDNAVNITAIFYAVHVHQAGEGLPKYLTTAVPHRLDLMSSSKPHHSRGIIGSVSGRLGGAHSLGGGRHGGGGRGGGHIPDFTPLQRISMSSQRRCVGPIKRLPPVLDMSPEVTIHRTLSSPAMLSSSPASPSGASTAAVVVLPPSPGEEVQVVDASARKPGSSGRQARASLGPLFFTSQTTKNRLAPPGSHPLVGAETAIADTCPDHTRKQAMTDEPADQERKGTTSAEPFKCAALTRSIDPPPPQQAAVPPPPLLHLAANQGTTGKSVARKVLGTPAIKSTAPSKVMEHRATTMAAGEEANALKTSAAFAAAAANVVWPLPLASLGARGEDGRTAAAVPPPKQAASRKKEEGGANERRKERKAGVGVSRALASFGRAAGEPGAGGAVMEPEATMVAIGPGNSALNFGSAVGRRGRKDMPTPARPKHSGRSSSSPGHRSVHARSAFSAASWRSSSYEGDGSRYDAPAVTVRSPASYFAGSSN